MLRQLKQIFIGALVGLVSGALILGLGGRMVMRLIAILGDLQGGFSWDGSMEVIALGMLIGLISGTIFALVLQFGHKKRPWTGLVYGILVFGSILILPIGGKGAAAGFPKLVYAIYLLFGFLFLLFGWTMATLFDRWGHK
ncbi:hypothetical protein [Sediminicola sp. 1XM1-17]|uniref:hypothetical protein n=1 Tax=Sediminicola sp. 1XM1-17 TaxID=3127702 RepID=UPI0030785DDC